MYKCNCNCLFTTMQYVSIHIKYFWDNKEFSNDEHFLKESK